MHFCKFCGEMTGNGVRLSQEHIVKQSIQKRLGISDELITVRLHNPATNEIEVKSPVRLMRHVQPRICDTCNSSTFNRVDNPAEKTIVGLAEGNMGFGALVGETAESLAWWALKVAVVLASRSKEEGMNAPEIAARAIVSKFRDKLPTAWPGGIAFVCKNPGDAKASTGLSGSPPFYEPSGCISGSFIASIVLLKNVMIGVAFPSNALLQITFVDGIQLPFFPRASRFRLVQDPRLPLFMEATGPSLLNAVLGSIGLTGFRRADAPNVNYLMPDGSPAMTPRSFAPTSEEWNKRFDRVRALNSVAGHPKVNRLFPNDHDGPDPEFVRAVRREFGENAARFVEGVPGVEPPF